MDKVHRLFWAKQGDDPGRPHHPLFCHLVDVAQVCLALWDRVVREPLRQQLSGVLRCEAEAAKRWIAFWVGSHDIGKLSPGFQKRKPDLVEPLKGMGFDFPVGVDSVPHGIVSACVLRDLLVRPAGWPATPAALGKRVAVAVGGHHGSFPRADQRRGVGSGALGNGKWQKARRETLCFLANVLGLASVPAPGAPPDGDHAFFLVLAGLTTVSDWIGSIEGHFPFAGGLVDEATYPRQAEERARVALDELGWTDWEGIPETLSFRDLFGGDKEFEPRPLQAEVMRRAYELEGPGLVLIEAPMGEGKTEAAFYLGDAWNCRLGQQGLYIAMPTQATSNQMFLRTRRFLAARYGERKVNLHLLHGGAVLSESYRRLRLAAIHQESPNYDGVPGRVVAEEWFVPKKRGLLAPFAVGTIDQALLATLQTRHFFVRLLGLTRKTIIFDEVHAYDAYMTTLLERLLEWLAALGSSVVILSATLPRARRRAIISAFGAPRDDGEHVPYPRVLTVTRNRLSATPVEASRATTIQLRWVDEGNLPQELWSALAAGGCAAVICNTVGRAQETYRALRDTLRGRAIEMRLFHARFPLGQREKIEGEVTQRFGRGGNRPDRSILVATQVIEQSLDLDFDLLVTETAPIDLILQRAGRLHRHSRPRPPFLAAAHVWLIRAETGAQGVPAFGPSEHVYDRHILLRSYLVLTNRDRIRVPGDIEDLIEAVYGNEGVEAPSQDWREALETSRERLDDRLARDRETALNCLIKAPTFEDDILEEFPQDLEEDNPAVHRTLQALTRLGDPTVSLVCLFDTPNGLAASPDGGAIVDPRHEPSLDETRDLLRCSLGISHPALVHHFLSTETPSGWRKTPLLRHHRLTRLDARGELRAAGYWFRLDQELGAVIGKAETGGTDL